MLRARIPAGRSRPLACLVCLALATLALPAAAATASEMLEKAIYTEETVGDLDQAIEIYEKVLAETRKSLDAAAEAQFRIGVCLAKQGKTDEAAKAFQAVVDGYPQAERWVAQAKDRLPGSPKLLPTPWGAGDEMQYEMKLPNGKGIGCQIYRVAQRQRDGVEAWECASWQRVIINGASGKSRVWADLDSFAPIESHWKHTLLGEADATYGKDKVVINLVGKDKPVDIKVTGPVYDNEQGAEMFRRLPLKVGYQAKVTVISSLTATEIPLAMSVTGVETIEAPAGAFECFRLHLDDLNQTFWISNDEHRYIVRFAAGGVVADLTEVRSSQLDEPKQVDGGRFSLTLPPDWFAYTPTEPEKDSRTTTWLIDPTAALDARIEAGDLALIREKVDSPRAWIDEALKGYRSRLQNVSLGPQGIRIVKIGKREAADAVFEFDDSGQAMKARRVALFGDKSAVNLRFTAPADEYDKWRPAIEEILASLRVN